MKDYRFLFMLVLSAGINFNVFSQGSPKVADPVIPPSPELAQLGKFGNIPVNPSTGAASVQIPVFTIKTPVFTWPITLSYHTGGIRVDEVPSSVGSGWGLDVISAVYRSIKGQPDEYGMLTNTIPYNVTALSSLPASQQLSIKQSVAGGMDTEPDEFSFNFHGKSGKFQLNREKGAILQSDDNLKIEFTQGQIRIIDESGNTYFFDSYESGTSRVYSPSGTPLGEQYDGITGWFLTKVRSQDMADSILFQYSTTYEVNQEQDQYSYKVGESATFNEVCIKGYQQPIIQRTGIQKTRTLTPELSTIIYRGGKLVLNYLKDRKDMGIGSFRVGDMGRLTSIDIYQNVNNVYQLLQKFRLHQSYTVSTTRPANRDSCYAYRLRLDSTSVVDKNNLKLSRGYRLEYNALKLPYRTSPSQDFWGFANGSNNTDLVPRRIISWSYPGGTNVYDLGTANRNADSVQMQAGSLNKIYYPTGGYTSFEFGAHRFYDPTPTTGSTSTTPIEVKVTAVPGSPNNIASKRFIQTAASQTVTVNAFFKAYYGKSDAPPYVKIKKKNGSVFSDDLVLLSPDAYNDRSVSSTYTLVNGNEYMLEAYVHAGSYPVNEVYATGSLYRDSIVVVPGSPNGYRTAGGMRIKSVSDYSATAQLATKTTYTYGDSGDGTLIAHLGVFNRDYLNIADNLSKWITNGPSTVCYDCSFNYRLYTDQSPYALGSLSGSPVGYTKVVKTITDNAGNGLGKEEFIYDVVPDDFDVIPTMDNYYPISRNWRNGKILIEKVYKSLSNGSSFEVQSKEYTYQDIKKDTVNYLMIREKFKSLCNLNTDHYIVFQGRRYYGKRLPLFIKTTIKNQDALGNTLTVVDTTWHEYSNTSAHNYPTKITTKNSNGKTLQQNFYYPQDMISKLADNGGGVYPSMVSKGMTGMLILQRDYIGTVLIQEKKTEFSAPYSSFIKPYKEFAKRRSFASELFKTFSYESKGNLSGILEERGLSTSYKWGYQEQYPILEVKNSAVNEVYSQNFEEPELGLDFEANVVYDNTRYHTGKYSGRIINPNATEFVSHSSKRLNISLSAPKKFTFSGWVFSNGPSVQLFLFMMKAGETGYNTYYDHIQTTTINKWVYVKKEFLVPADVVQMFLRLDNNAAGTVWFDDLRIQPSDASMTTYTYDPTVGMTSAIDDSGKTVYYEYDTFQRLMHVKDQNGDIIKKYDYHYKP